MVPRADGVGRGSLRRSRPLGSYTHERLPQGPQWSEVQRLLDANRGDTDTQIRNYAMLVLLAVYGFRSGEVRGLTLDDIDWEHERIHPPRPKQRKVGEYPLVREAGDAILRYVTVVRPHCASRVLFVTLRRPYRPLSDGGLGTMVRVRQLRLGQTLHRYGPHGLRHASATYLLSEGFTLKQIGDHLGHTMVRATEVYAKVDIASLREVGNMDMAALVEHERRCASSSTPFFEAGDLACPPRSSSSHAGRCAMTLSRLHRGVRAAPSIPGRPVSRGAGATERLRQGPSATSR